MSKLTASVTLGGLRQRITNYKTNLQNELTASWPIIVADCLANVVSRAPTPAQELDFITGGHGQQIYQTSGKNSGVRVTFNRYPGNWIQDVILEPGNRSSSATNGNYRISLGFPAYLEARTHYSWTNVSKGQQISHVSRFGVWERFEMGATAYILPVNWPGSSGKYHLRPAPGVHFPDMVKAYPRFAFYSGFNYSVFSNAVTQVINNVKF